MGHEVDQTSNDFLALLKLISFFLATLIVGE
jgi:hypothetical protein